MSRNPILVDVRPGDNLWCPGDRHKTGHRDCGRSEPLDGSVEGHSIRVRGVICLVEPRGFEPLTSAVRLRRSPN
jgi:hypothetical protein